LNKLLEDGNTLFKKGGLSEAAHRYQYALRRLPSSFAGQHRPLFEQLQIHLLLNLSRCKRKDGDDEEAVKLADRALQVSPVSYEAHYAKAKAHREGGRLREALAALTEASRVAPQNRDVHRIILRVRAEIKESEAKAAAEEERDNKRKLRADADSTTSGVDSSTGSSCARDFEESANAANNATVVA